MKKEAADAKALADEKKAKEDKEKADKAAELEKERK